MTFKKLNLKVDEYKQTVRATDEFGEFIQPNQQNGDIINLINNKEMTEQQQRKHSKRRKQSSSSGQKYVVYCVNINWL